MFNLEINKYILNGRIDVRKEVVIAYISSNGDIDKTKEKILAEASRYEEEQKDVYEEYISALEDLFGTPIV